MSISTKAQHIFSTLASDTTKLGDLKKIAKEIKKDHDLAMELWSTQGYFPRLLATLIMDKKLLSQHLINTLDDDIQIHSVDERNHIMEWLMANQLMKAKNTILLIQSWRKSSSILQRRTFWYYQARIRWTGQTPPENSSELLSAIESDLMTESTEVQWAMNFTAAWIGIYEEKYRNRCVEIGKNTALYKDEIVAKGCTPNYLPLFIETEVKKRYK